VLAQQPSDPEKQFANFFLGTWHCADTVGDYAGTYTTNITRTLDNTWLKQTYEFPVSSALPKGLRGEYLIGFDPRIQKWVRFGAMNDGMYFAMVGTRKGDTLSYGYVLPGTSGSAVYARRSATQYTVLGPTYQENGKQVTEHHGCRKAG
jgi:hypothetical protein